MEQPDERNGQPTTRHLMTGLVLIVVGIAFMVDRITILDVEGRWWPFIPLAVGAVTFLVPSASGRGAGSRRPGAWLLFIGCWGLVNEFHLFGLDYGTSWPLMIVGVGLMIVWRAFEGPHVCARAAVRRQEP